MSKLLVSEYCDVRVVGVLILAVGASRRCRNTGVVGVCRTCGYLNTEMSETVVGI